MGRQIRIAGYCVVEMTCADISALINTANNSGIGLWDVVWCDDLTLQAKVSRKDYRQTVEIAEKKGASVKLLGVYGLQKTVKGIVKRPVLVSFLCILLLIGWYLPTRILFISVEGNMDIPANQILEAAEACGIRFGTSRRKVRSEVMKNALLQKIPQLQWAGINTAGCTAVISVKEKTVQEKMEDGKNQVCSIIAARDGIIQSCTVTQGNPLCFVGQAVKAGQTLVSGYTDCGIIIKATRADAEVQALTSRQLEVIAPHATTHRGELLESKTTFGLRIGKKLIKFSKDSGISDTTCAKIYSEEYVHLPGGFRLPIAVIKETLLVYDDAPETLGTSQESWVPAAAQMYLQSTMIAGEIVSSQTEMNTAAGATYLNGRYVCLEMIGQVKYEDLIQRNEMND